MDNYMKTIINAIKHWVTSQFTEKDAIRTSVEMGFVTPFADENNALFTDETGEQIYIL